MVRVKEKTESILIKFPKLYANLLYHRSIYNFEKILFIELINSGDIVFDIGANRGYYTLLFSKLVGKNGQVHGFEPVPPTFQKLVEKFSHHPVHNFYLNFTALGNENGTISIYLPDEDDGQASLHTHQFGSWQQPQSISTYSCPITRLDDYVSNLNLTKIDFIKCDVEGAELLVLKGGLNTIKKFSPLLYLEFCYEWTKNFGYDGNQLFDFIKNLNYTTFYWIKDTIYPLTNPEQELSQDNFSGSANLLCLSAKHQNFPSQYLLTKYPTKK